MSKKYQSNGKKMLERGEKDNKKENNRRQNTKNKYPPRFARGEVCFVISSRLPFRQVSLLFFLLLLGG